jgi:NAD(P)-dependent dehydrogenase (short-subunit alcohol dehydrogenase family)
MLVAGGSSGIGRATGDGIHRLHVTSAVVDIEETRARAAVEDPGGEQLFAFQVDVSSRSKPRVR